LAGYDVAYRLSVGVEDVAVIFGHHLHHIAPRRFHCSLLHFRLNSEQYYSWSARLCTTESTSNRVQIVGNFIPLVCLMRYEGWTLRKTEVRLAKHRELREALELNKAPDYTLRSIASLVGSRNRCWFARWVRL
jgi:hypothetical protein